MTKIKIPFDCNNSSKKEFLKDFNIAFAKGNVDFIVEHVSDAIVWNIHGNKKIEGIRSFSEEIHKMKENRADELTLHSIITQGKEGSANGEIKIGEKHYAFSDVYQFTSTSGKTIKKMDSYMLAL